ncbi:FAD-dependent monooxygenase [Streptomyces echinoruber]|uniref:FAD-binding domain-containing protein n=1 Tax=Streptomyces echinoruber TaxID=68898 RepID=A0A918R9T6_9ACTN|nr:FAD-dependent monooxygenase [Streptomyces echinoruber]GGZ90907.1 hypothetical protein GCM10010389_31720 [Streptomyces echinoruber]
MSRDSDVLVVGAGPTGLAAACTLLREGVPVRVVDRRRGPTALPKALIVWSGALEVLDRLGVADALAERALRLRGASYWSRGRAVASVGFGALAGSRFPGPLCVPQPVTEELLYERLLQLGGRVEWGTEAADVTVEGDAVRVGLRTAPGGAHPPGTPAAPQTARARWLVAADGAHSTVRTSLGIPFEGGTYARDFLLGDGVVKVEGPAAVPVDEAQYHLTPDGVLVVVALPEGGHRVFFDQPAGSGEAAPALPELQALLDARGPGGWTLADTTWTSRFRVHTRVAARFRQGPVLLAGDAAHCHSPAGGQGLNTGVQDAYDLGWKLTAVLGGADESLLDSYEAERRPAAVRAVSRADAQTRLWLLRSPLARLARDTALRALSASGLLEKRLVPELAQVDPDLTGSPAVGGPAGDGIVPGRRIPDAPLSALHGRQADTLHGYLAAGRHTVVVLGTSAYDEAAVRAARRACAHDTTGRLDVLLIRPGALPGAGALPAHDTADGRLGTTSQAVYVRPDGVVGARLPLGGTADVNDLLARVPVLKGAVNHRVPPTR